MSIELNRSAFEAFAQRNEFGTYRIDRKGDGYDSSHTQLMWMSWCAAIQQAEAKTDEPVAWLYIEDGEVMFGHPNGYRPPDARPLVFGDTHPAPGVPDGWSDRHTRVAAFALRRFADAAWERSDEAAQKNYMGNPSDYKAFQSDAKDAEEARAILLAASQAQKVKV